MKATVVAILAERHFDCLTFLANVMLPNSNNSVLTDYNIVRTCQKFLSVLPGNGPQKSKTGTGSMVSYTSKTWKNTRPDTIN